MAQQATDCTCLVTVIKMQSSLCRRLILADSALAPLPLMERNVVFRLYTVGGANPCGLFFHRCFCVPILRAVLSVTRLAAGIGFPPGVIKIEKHTQINPAVWARSGVLWPIFKHFFHPKTIAIAMLLPVLAFAFSCV